MSTSRTRGQKRRAVAATGRVQIIIALTVLASVMTALTMLGYSGALDSAFRQKRENGQPVSPSSLNSNSPSKEYVYAGGRLVATEEPASSSCSPPPAPGNTLFATAQSVNSVALTWGASPGADHYEVQRKQHFADGWTNLTPNPATPLFNDNGVVANTGYLYRVRAVDASGACPSDYSNVDLATTVIFTEDPLQGQFTTIKALHITQARAAIDAVRSTANLGPATWTNPLYPQLDPVRPLDFNELRTGLNDALSALSSLGFSQLPADSGIALGQTVYATHLQAVRDKVK